MSFERVKARRRFKSHLHAHMLKHTNAHALTTCSTRKRTSNCFSYSVRRPCHTCSTSTTSICFDRSCTPCSQAEGRIMQLQKKNQDREPIRTTQTRERARNMPADAQRPNLIDPYACQGVAEERHLPRRCHRASTNALANVLNIVEQEKFTSF